MVGLDEFYAAMAHDVHQCCCIRKLSVSASSRLPSDLVCLRGGGVGEGGATGYLPAHLDCTFSHTRGGGSLWAGLVYVCLFLFHAGAKGLSFLFVILFFIWVFYLLNIPGGACCWVFCCLLCEGVTYSPCISHP